MTVTIAPTHPSSQPRSGPAGKNAPAGLQGVQEVRVASWNALNDALFGDAWQEPIGRFRSPFVFRGLGSARHDLTTSLLRLCGPEQAGHLETPLLRTFRRYAHQAAVPEDSIWNWLALAQHHHLPTRLLDWTYSPFVALHFATAVRDDWNDDAVVWCLDYAATNAFLPPPLTASLERERASVFTVEMLGAEATTLLDFDRLAAAPFVVFLEPPSLDERIVNQFALFALMSSPEARLDDWLQSHPTLCRRVVLPAGLKAEVRDKLDQSNITERVLFPGLDGLCAWLARYYQPKQHAATNAATAAAAGSPF